MTPDPLRSPRVVIDTNVYLSHIFRPGSIPNRAVLRVWREAIPLQSEATLTELRVVLGREKIRRYLPPGSAEKFLSQLREISTPILVRSQVQACRDSRDDKFLELAVDGKADFILTGDADLLVLHPFRGISILTPAQYLENHPA